MRDQATAADDGASQPTEQDDRAKSRGERKRRKGEVSVALPARKPDPTPAKPVIQLRKENWYPLVRDFLDWYAHDNKTPKSVLNRRQSLQDFERWARAKGIPLCVEQITRQHVQDYMTDHFSSRHLAPNTARQHLTSLKLFFRWLHDDGAIAANPCAKVLNPIAPDQPRPVFTDDELRRLFATCERGTDFRSRRDYAMLRLLLSCGIRRGEMANLHAEDFNREEREVRVHGKQRRYRTLSYGRKANDALRKYFRAREAHRYAASPQMWLGLQGPLTYEGVYQVVRRRAKEAGMADKCPHLFRHTASHLWLRKGKSEEGLMKRMGWKSRTMLGIYGAGMAEERSREEYRRDAPDDEI